MQAETAITEIKHLQSSTHQLLEACHIHSLPSSLINALFQPGHNMDESNRILRTLVNHTRFVQRHFQDWLNPNIYQCTSPEHWDYRITDDFAWTQIYLGALLASLGVHTQEVYAYTLFVQYVQQDATTYWIEPSLFEAATLTEMPLTLKVEHLAPVMPLRLILPIHTPFAPQRIWQVIIGIVGLQSPLADPFLNKILEFHQQKPPAFRLEPALVAYCLYEKRQNVIQAEIMQKPLLPQMTLGELFQEDAWIKKADRSPTLLDSCQNAIHAAINLTILRQCRPDLRNEGQKSNASHRKRQRKGLPKPMIMEPSFLGKGFILHNKVSNDFSRDNWLTGRFSMPNTSSFPLSDVKWIPPQRRGFRVQTPITSKTT